MVTLLKNRNFTLLWGGQAISQLGNSVFYVAFIWIVVELTGSATAVGGLLIASQVPALACQLVSGVIVDRYDRRWIAFWTDLIRGILIAGLGFAILAGRLELWQLYVLAVALGVAGAFFGPAIRAFLPSLVPAEQLVAANGLWTAAREFMEILGPVAGGFLLAAVGAGGVSILNALSFGAGALGLWLVRLASPPAATARQAIWHDFVEGLRYLRTYRAVMMLLGLVAVLNCVSAPIGILLPLFVRQVLGGGPESYGLLLSSMAVGLLIGSFLMGLWRIKRKGLFLLGVIILLGLSFGGVALTKTLPAALVVLGLAGLLNAMANVVAEALLQSIVAEGYRGRVFALATFMAGGLQPIAWGLVGVLADWLGVVTIMLASGLLASFIGALGLLSRDLRQLS
ncbi:MAG: MFS transporter [Candidatus Bipolaricaulota bacterium]|nr:MFS transporter [Candidatus Bipolaricaulota bacterium]